MKCPQCGTENEASDGCSVCGLAFRRDPAGSPEGYAHAQPRPGYPWPPYYGYGVNPGYMPVVNKGRNMAVASISCGIAGLTLAFYAAGGLGIITLVLGILAVVFARKAAREGYKEGLTTGGLVTGIISLVAGVLWILFLGAYIAMIVFLINYSV